MLTTDHPLKPACGPKRIGPPRATIYEAFKLLKLAPKAVAALVGVKLEAKPEKESKSKNKNTTKTKKA